MADGKAQIILSAVDKTSAAFKSAMANMAALKASGEGLTSGLAAKFGTLGVAIAAAFQAASYKGVIDAIDHTNDLSERTGVAVEQLSALSYAGQLSDASLEDLANGLRKLAVNMADAAGGGKDSAAAFEAVGVSIKNAAGNLRNTDDVLGDIADKFAGYSDGAEKAALATALFGKNGTQLIPFLNNGKAGLADLKTEAEKLGVVFGDKLAKDAAAFNDNLDRLSAAASGAKVAILNDLLPALNTLLTELIEGRKAFGGFGAALLELGLKSKPFASYSEGAAEARKDIAQLEDQLKRLRNGDGPTFGEAILGGRRSIDQGAVQEKLDAANKRLQYFNALQSREALQVDGTGVADVNERLRPPGKTAAPIIKKPDPAAADKAAAEALAVLGKLTEGRIKRAQEGAQAEQDIARHREQVLRGMYELGESSLSDFYAKQDDLRRQNLEATKRALNEEIKAREEQLASPLLQGKDKQSEREDIKNKIAEARSKLSAADREFEQQGETSEIERRRTTQDLLQQVEQIDIRIKALAGDDAGAAMLENARQVAEARRLLTQAGGDAGKAEDLAAALDLQTKFNQAQKDFGLYSQQAANAEERLLIAARTGGKGLLEAEDDLKSLRQQSLAQLSQLIAKTEELAAKSKDPSVLQYLDDLKLRYEQLAEVQDPRKIRFDAAADNIGDSIADGFERAVTEGQKLSEVMRGIAKDIGSIAIKELVTKPLAQDIANFVKGAGGQGAGENLLGLLDFSRAKAAKPGDANFVGPLPEGVEAQKAEPSIVDRVKQFFGIGQQAPKSIAGEKPAPVFSPQGASASLDTLRQASDAAAQALQRIADSQTAPAQGVALPTTGDLSRADRTAEAGQAAEQITDAGKSADSAGDKVDNLGLDAQVTAGLLGQLGKESTAAAIALRLLSAVNAGSGDSSGGGFFGKLFGGLFGGSGGGATNTVATDEALALFFHTGGVVAEGTDARPIDLGRLPKYHTGGLAGLKADETLAVLLKNEEVLTHDDPRHRKNLPDKVFERVMAMKEGASLSSIAGFDVRGLSPSQIVSRETHQTSTEKDTRRDTEREALHERLLEKFDTKQLRQLESATHGQLEKVLQDSTATAWSEVERYHTGGIAGLKADEVPAVLKRGEEVLTQADPRHRDNGGGGNDRMPMAVHNHFVIQPGTSRDTQEQIASAASRGILKARSRGTA